MRAEGGWRSHRAQPVTVRACEEAERAFLIVGTLTHPVIARVVRDPLKLLADYLKEKGAASDLHVIIEPGFVGVDGVSDMTMKPCSTTPRHFINERLQAPDFHPDSWPQW